MRYRVLQRMCQHVDPSTGMVRMTILGNSIVVLGTPAAQHALFKQAPFHAKPPGQEIAFSLLVRACVFVVHPTALVRSCICRTTEYVTRGKMHKQAIDLHAEVNKVHVRQTSAAACLHGAVGSTLRLIQQHCLFTCRV